jgi:flagellar motility protein MotE (MotC chaperone)
MEFICKQALALTELLRNELPLLFREHPAPYRLMDAIRELHEFAATGSNEPEAGKIGLLLIEQLCQELDRAFAEQHHRLHDEIARLSEELARRKHQLDQLDTLREKSSQLQELQKAFRLLEV